MRTPLFLALVALMASPTAFADGAVKKRMNNQQDKILDGLFSDRISEVEYKALQRQQNKINNYKKKANADGELSDKEKNKLGNMQDRALTNIQNKKRNNNDKADVNLRQKRQDERIYNGVDNGTLTQKEFNKLQDKQANIDAYEKAALADGHLSDKEQAKLQKKQNRASKAIHRMKHNKAGKMGKVKSAQ